VTLVERGGRAARPPVDAQGLKGEQIRNRSVTLAHDEQGRMIRARRLRLDRRMSIAKIAP
jgi:hypothetical protein